MAGETSLLPNLWVTLYMTNTNAEKLIIPGLSIWRGIFAPCDKPKKMKVSRKKSFVLITSSSRGRLDVSHQTEVLLPSKAAGRL